MMSSLTIAATASVIGRFAGAGAAAGGASTGAVAAAGATTGGGGALAGAFWAQTPIGKPAASRAVATTAPRAPRPVTLRARIMDEFIPSFGRVRPQFLSAIKWSAQCGER